MKWTVEHRKCDCCGKEAAVALPTLGIPFEGWSEVKTLNLLNAELDICHDCSECLVSSFANNVLGRRNPAWMNYPVPNED